MSNDFVNDTIYLTNTSKGSSRNLTFSVERPMQDDGWSWRASYTSGRVREVQYGTSSVARSNWANRAILNQGEDVVSRGELEIRHRFLAQVRKSFDWGNSGHRTSVSLLYEGRSGLPFSFRASNDVNNDGVTNNDLIFIPERGDPRVTFRDHVVGGRVVQTAAEAEEIFFRMVSNHGLQTGQVAPSGAGRYPFVHQFDFNITQEFNLPGWRHNLELSLDILNVGNLLNSSWGLIRGSNSFFVKSEPVAQVTYNSATDSYTYGNINENLADRNFNPFNNRGEPDASRWSGLVSVRYRF
ncbi:MAG: hypothetical protein JJT96_08580 [Opitutales bacterium]|nr:hypothetical protein [Opitutales bacterium]